MIRTLVAAPLLVGIAGFLSACALDERAQLREVTGTLDVAEAAALPAAGQVVLEVRGPDGALLARGRGPVDQPEPPLPFRLAVPAAPAGEMVASLEVDGAAQWRSAPRSVPRGGATDIGTLTLEPVAAAPAAHPPVTTARLDPVPGEPGLPEEVDVAGPETALLADPEPVASDLAGDVTFRCGEDTVTAGIGREAVTLRVGSTVLTLEAAETASGARYALPDDPATFFWSRGDRALVSLAGVILPECVPV